MARVPSPASAAECWTLVQGTRVQRAEAGAGVFGARTRQGGERLDRDVLPGLVQERTESEAPSGWQEGLLRTLMKVPGQGDEFIVSAGLAGRV